MLCLINILLFLSFKINTFNTINHKWKSNYVHTHTCKTYILHVRLCFMNITILNISRYDLYILCDVFIGKKQPNVDTNTPCSFPQAALSALPLKTDVDFQETCTNTHRRTHRGMQANIPAGKHTIHACMHTHPLQL